MELWNHTKDYIPLFRFRMRENILVYHDQRIMLVLYLKPALKKLILGKLKNTIAKHSLLKMGIISQLKSRITEKIYKGLLK